MIPVKLSLKSGSLLFVKWNDGSETEIKISNLRSKCPCAICGAEKDKRGSKYIPIYTKDQLDIRNISIVGQYAVGVEWADGHNTGIYDFNYLKMISDVVTGVEK